MIMINNQVSLLEVSHLTSPSHGFLMLQVGSKVVPPSEGSCKD